ncbi:uncharacterized protein LOC131330646 [Rhododendron vialii]|uniref:uncharacterized protein LOC131330646 n=1 Tax=Rhododendron vialii TaxID=182163 RepID=UPI00265DF854|nr:uncharacterized protein LOC131330646 [Rhododendron vialii]
MQENVNLRKQISEPSIPRLQNSRHGDDEDMEEGESSEKESQNRRKYSKPPLEKSPHEQEAILKMQNQIEGLMKHVKAQTPSTVEELVQNTDSPFPLEVMGRTLPRKFKMPQLETFNGSTDPLDHLETYKSLMHLQAMLDQVMCRAFPVTLKASARAWFNKLPPGSIRSFKELSTSFVSYFKAGQRYGKPATHLLMVKQGRWESLREYTTKFNKEVVQIDEADDNVSITAYIAGLYSGQFLYLVSQEPPKTMAELMLRAQKHMNAEEAIYERRTHDGFDPQTGTSQIGEFPPIDKKRREAVCKLGGEPKNKKVDSRSSSKRGVAGGPPQGKYKQFTLLIATAEQILSNLKEDTNKEGRDGTTPRSGPIGEIKVIHGGFAGGGESSNARKAHLRKLRTEEHLERKEEIPTIFSEEDVKGIQIPHDDPLVITIVVANYLTRRVLIDSGSSADILYLHAYDQLKVGREG